MRKCKWWMQCDKLCKQLIKLPQPLNTNTNTNWDVAIAPSSSISKQPVWGFHAERLFAIVKWKCCKFSHLGKAKPLKSISFGVSEFGPIRDVMLSLHMRLQPVLELTTQNQQQLWKSYFCFKTIHSGFRTWLNLIQMRN